MNNYTERIDQYLNRTMSPEERMEFEKELLSNPNLSLEFDVQRNIMEGLLRVGIKAEFAKAIKNHLWQKALLKASIIIVVAVVLAGLAYYMSGTRRAAGKHVVDERSKALETQAFQLQTDRDTVIETRDGLVFAIPAGAFDTEEKNVNFDIQVALKPADIVGAGLSTISDGKLLETAGMLYLNASNAAGESLGILKPIDASIPTGTVKPGMMLFDGVMDEKGHINWVNPKPLEKGLVTYDIETLDFYPEKYLPTLKVLGLNTTDKRYTDSLYYSFSGYGGEVSNPSFDNTEVRGDIDTYQGHVNGKLIIFKDRAAMLKWADSMSGLGSELSYEAIRGLALFKANCDNCHDMMVREVAPALQGVNERHSREWLLKWIKNNEKLRASGDKEALAVYSENGKAAMNIFENLSDEEIKSIITYFKEWKLSSREIDPSRIRAIWDESFNNTILATREFEERLKFIFTTCNSKYLDIYVNNLDKPLYIIDSMCATISGGADSKFGEFYKRKDGGVKVSGHLQRKLNKYFSQKYKAYKMAAKKTRQKYEAGLQKLQEIANEKQREQLVSDFKRETKNFDEEFCLNLVEAYKQLGQEAECPQTTPPPSDNYYRASISSPGWKNLDRYVMEATNKRESLEYIDEAGKRAIITYSPLTINVKNVASFDKVYVYLIPDSLSSFQRMNEKDGKFSEKLNNLLHYDLFILGYKNKQSYIADEGNIRPGKHEFNLQPCTDEQIDAKLSRYGSSKAKDLEIEFSYRNFEQVEIRRKAILLEISRQRDEIAQAIFPCFIDAKPKSADISIDLSRHMPIAK